MGGVSAQHQAELGVVGFVVGYDFRFGWRGEGNTGRLRDYCAANGLTCDVVDKVELDGITVSSTYIRSLLREGDMLRAEYFMGHPHFLTDVVRHGHRLGHHLGAPTVNMQFAPGVLVPPHGVYAARALLPEGEFPAVTNIGVRPTVSSEPVVTVESHLLGFDRNLYGRTLALEFFDFLRPGGVLPISTSLARRSPATASAPGRSWRRADEFCRYPKKFSGGDRAAVPTPAAPSAQAEMMQALRKQEFTPPKPRPTAAEVIRQHPAALCPPAEEMRDRIPATGRRAYPLPRPWHSRNGKPVHRARKAEETGAGCAGIQKRSAAICRLSAAALRRIYRKLRAAAGL